MSKLLARFKSHPRVWGVILTLVVAIGYALSPVMVGGIAYLFPGGGQVVIRSGVTAAMILAYLLIVKAEWRLASPKTAGLWFVWYAFALPVGQVLFVIAILTGGISAGPAALFYLSASKVVITFLAKNFWLKESDASVGRVVIVVLAVVAMAVFSWPDPLTFTLPMVAAMGTGAIEAISSLSMGKLAKQDNRYVLAFARYGLAMVALLIVMPLIGRPVVMDTQITLPLIVLAVGMLLLNGLNQAFIGRLEIEAYQLIDEDLANILLTTELIWGVLFSLWFLGNRVNLYQLIGVALILLPSAGAAYLAYLKKRG